MTFTFVVDHCPWAPHLHTTSRPTWLHTHITHASVSSWINPRRHPLIITNHQPKQKGENRPCVNILFYIQWKYTISTVLKHQFQRSSHVIFLQKTRSIVWNDPSPTSATIKLARGWIARLKHGKKWRFCADKSTKLDGSREVDLVPCVPITKSHHGSGSSRDGVTAHGENKCHFWLFFLLLQLRSISYTMTLK
jgi:hypothetical protein